MRAMMVDTWGEPETLTLKELPDPTAGRGQVVVDVHAAACNFFDALIVQGKYQMRPPLPFAPGAEVAGVVSAVGEGVEGVAVGDRVMCMLPFGGYATKVAAGEKNVFKIPDAMPFDQAASLGIVYQTAYFALVYRANLQAGETLLVHAAAGGVGLATVQVGKALGARVIATASTEEKLARAAESGADEGFTYRDDGWIKKVKKATGGRGADVIFDPVGGEIYAGSTRCVAFGGRILIIGFASGSIPTEKLNRVLLKNISLVGLHWGAYQMYDPDKIGEAMRALFALYDTGKIKPQVSASYALEDAAAAIGHITSRKSVGKVVITP